MRPTVSAPAHVGPFFGDLRTTEYSGDHRRQQVDLMAESAPRCSPFIPHGLYGNLYIGKRQGWGVDELAPALEGPSDGFAGAFSCVQNQFAECHSARPGVGGAEVSQANEKGWHTTNVRQMFPLPDGGYVADLPGLRILSLWEY
jgi:ribosome biogenesis GTPase